jgi:PPP family 3-phenylpropionic acid transporter
LFPATPRQRLSAWYFWYFAHVGAFTPYFSLYLESLAIPASTIGFMMSAMLSMRIVAPLVWGSVTDRWIPRSSLLRTTAVLATACFGSMLLTDDAVLLTVAMAVLAFFWSAALPMVEALTLNQLAGCTEYYGRIRLWGSIGFIVAVVAVGAWLDRATLRSLLWIDLGLLGAWVLGTWTLPGVAVDRSPTRPATPWLQMLRPEVLVLLAASLLMAAAHGPFYVFFSIHLVDHGYGKTAVGLLWSLGVVAEIIVFIVMPRLLAWTTPARLLLASLALAVLRFLLIGWLADQPVVMVLAQTLHGATFGAAHAAAVAQLNSMFPPAQQARAQALYGSLAVGGGGMIGNLLGGATWQALGPELTFTLAGMMALGGLLVAWFGPLSGRKDAFHMR